MNKHLLDTENLSDVACMLSACTSGPEPEAPEESTDDGAEDRVRLVKVASEPRQEGNP